MEATQSRRMPRLLILSIAIGFASPARAVGPDIIVGEVAGNNDILRYGTVNGVAAYAVRTTSCNIGDTDAAWYSQTNQHPVISTGLFRIKDGEFRQIGLSWLKHGFATENDELPGCGTCTPTDGDTLGPGCADTYSAQLNGIQSFLGPRDQVNPSSGFFPFPFTAPPAQPVVGRRLQVRETDINPMLNPGARYFVESQYVSADDAQFGNSANNASYREVLVTSEIPSGFRLTPTGPTIREQPAVFAWKAVQPEVKLTQVVVLHDGAPGYRGYFWVAARAIYRGDCRWKYEYSVQNLNSHQACSEFAVQLPTGVTVTKRFCKVFKYPDGRTRGPLNWWSVVADDQIRWFSRVPGSPTELIPLNWGTVYNFSFEVDAPPACDAIATLRLYRTPDAEPFVVDTIGPVAGDPCSGGEPVLFFCE